MDIIQNKKYRDWEDSCNGEGWLTFFTPTYNRAQFLPRLFEMLKNQTDNHFIWLLVCDGSQDDTLDVAKELLAREDFPMMFIYKENGGKHSAFKVALDNTSTEFFICMDDDDLYNELAVETFLKEWLKISEEGLTEEIGAIRTLSRHKDGSYASNIPIVMGERFDCTTLERNYVYNIYQENWTCYRTKALKSVELFPDNYWLKEKHKFFLESIWQGRFARKYKCRYYNVCLREYTDDAATSLMRSAKTRTYYLNMFINYKMELDEQLDYKVKAPKVLISNILIVSILRKKIGLSFMELIRNTHSRFLRNAYILTLPIAWISWRPKMVE